MPEGSRGSRGVVTLDLAHCQGGWALSHSIAPRPSDPRLVFKPFDRINRGTICAEP